MDLELVEADRDLALQAVDVIVEVNQRNNRDEHDHRTGGEGEEEQDTGAGDGHPGLGNNNRFQNFAIFFFLLR